MTETIPAPPNWSPFSPPSHSTSSQPQRQLVFPAYLYPGGTYALDGIALRACAIGAVGALSFNLAWNLRSGFFQVPFFVGLLAVFHFLEFWITARFNSRRAKVEAFLLTNNGAAYNIAHSAAITEALLESYFFPSLKSHTSIQFLGIFLIIVGQAARSYAMAHAGSNFSHFIAEQHVEGHVLVKTGIYKYIRHPSYFGFFWWGVGTQIMLANPVCLVGYAVVLWSFFNTRIRHEEELLISFFKEDYELYRATTPTLIPLIS